MKCLECGKECKSQRSLHAHLKAHKMSVADYYVKFEPRFDALTGGPIRFKNLDHYRGQFFSNPAHMSPWLKKASPSEARDMIQKVFAATIEGKDLVYSPTTLFNQSYRIFDRSEIESVMSWDEFCFEHELVNAFYGQVPDHLWTSKESVEILVDTREQNAFKFDSKRFPVSVREQKLDFGDYSRGDKHDGTAVERKSLADYIGTLTQGFDRFEKELERAKKLDGYVFMVVEASKQDVFEYNQNNRYKISIDRLWHESREVMSHFPRHLQIIFAGNRSAAAQITARILQHGKSLWRVDMQHELDERIRQFKK